VLDPVVGWLGGNTEKKMTSKDLIYLNLLRTQQRVLHQIGDTLHALILKLDNSQQDDIFSINTTVTMKDGNKYSFNLGDMGLPNNNSIHNYELYLKSLLKSVGEGYKENQIKISAMESKNVKKNLG